MQTKKDSYIRIESPVGYTFISDLFKPALNGNNVEGFLHSIKHRLFLVCIQNTYQRQLKLCILDDTLIVRSSCCHFIKDQP